MTTLVLTILLGSSIGLLLGLIGSGGSVLTVPVFVYLLDMDAKTAIAASLVVVGVTSLVGCIDYLRKKLVDWRVALSFGLIAMVGTYTGARLAQYMDGSWQLALFAVLIVVAAVLMLRESFKSRQNLPQTGSKHDYGAWTYPLILIEGMVVGVLTGLVGIGGGFLVVPALVLLAGLPMQVALGTSLCIITLKSMSGVMGYLDQVTMPWSEVSVFSGLAICGVLIGSRIMYMLPQHQLERVFSVFLLLVGTFVFVRTSLAL